MTRFGSDDSLTMLEKTDERGEIFLTGYSPIGVPVDRDRLDIFRAISPHVFHAISLSRQFSRLKVDRRLTRDALARADIGCVLVNSHGIVDWMNTYASDAVARADAIEVKNELLFATHPAVRGRMRRAVSAALSTEKPNQKRVRAPLPIFELQRVGEGRPVEVLVSPLRPLGHPLFGEVRGAMIIFADPEHLDEGIASRLEQVYGLTPTEAEVAQWLMAGSSTNDIADIFGNSVHTIRTHVKRIMDKCDASSQVELVGRLQRSLVRLA
jgi:DNA-binding CsgD family transcriptional regulator